MIRSLKKNPFVLVMGERRELNPRVVNSQSTVTGILVIGLIGIFFYGSYSGLGSSL